ncbi:ABC transporter permease [Lichenibacterium ramalinae]|uniref:ABC transporter permease n=1 Tax=Lichenibacterium ramalinae TaxID=2316527 RepID=A0A4Q2RFR0_9HYPH|nr:ABC transporter permease [Lichenibacterium ramalinae]RYB07007.1 ABC transporter permease [Lichenibacterium ramalinae]
MRSTEALPALQAASSPERPWVREWRLAALDLARCFRGWHVWALLGVSDIRLRYKRSRFGQFWITLSMAFFVAGIGAVYGGLFHQNIHEYIPYLAVNMTIWTFISTSISESCSAFIEAAPYLRQEALPKSTFIMRVLVRNMMAFGHNIIIIPLVFIVFLYAPSPVALLAIPGLLLVLAGVFAASISLALLCTRFRDMPQIVGNLLQLAFFVTPIMWHVEQLGPNAYYIKVFNPFASFLRVVSEPLLGHVPAPETYGTVLVALCVLSLIAWPVFAKFRSRIVYWL